ncbi:conserved hypothetical protein [Streptomyces pristinaespiralis ATCC 25486]|uniref:Uncharacterized protein n=1 Tax=Streptomyces pristinaespiralis (strain ATCC 25486 / DSM 40338 / CBS 914.69 / JCM 4507 / KCC S-0507 / NBRC 13074 / NRRL 2958 / 5647) TaxID=457429 RepID=B5HEH1_STRE2|nr:conserved hypothetical protein [Streptomyces pristinaespiralis ATCC 25486]
MTCPVCPKASWAKPTVCIHRHLHGHHHSNGLPDYSSCRAGGGRLPGSWETDACPVVGGGRMPGSSEDGAAPARGRPAADGLCGRRAHRGRYSCA